jgi:hypothetical protein
MAWCSSSEVTRFAAGHRQFIGEVGIDGRHYFDVPAEFFQVARHVGLEASAPPPAPAAALAPAPPLAVPAQLDEDAMIEKIMLRMESQFVKIIHRSREEHPLPEGK